MALFGRTCGGACVDPLVSALAGRGAGGRAVRAVMAASIATPSTLERGVEEVDEALIPPTPRAGRAGAVVAARRAVASPRALAVRVARIVGRRQHVARRVEVETASAL